VDIDIEALPAFGGGERGMVVETEIVAEPNDRGPSHDSARAMRR
jgi:hypothetical protein